MTRTRNYLLKIIAAVDDFAGLVLLDIIFARPRVPVTEIMGYGVSKFMVSKLLFQYLER